MSDRDPLVFITGASSGIGQALAARFHAAGFRLALVARRADAVAQWAAASGIAPARCAIYAADVRDVAAITIGRQCIEQHGLPDVVIANAGISVGVDTGDAADLEVIRATYETNNLGMAATFHPFVAAMVARRSGALVGIASVAGIRGLPGHALLSSKAAAIVYCESLRGEMRLFGVGWSGSSRHIDTPLTRGNRYSMPFLMSAGDFAARLFRVIEAGRSLRFIPWQMGWVARLLKILPNALYDRLLAGRPRKRRRSQ
jgi:NADP-dependent 3-hydroxy acid dehydrogenase YdfG